MQALAAEHAAQLAELRALREAAAAELTAARADTASLAWRVDAFAELEDAKLRLLLGTAGDEGEDGGKPRRSAGPGEDREDREQEEAFARALAADMAGLDAEFARLQGSLAAAREEHAAMRHRKAVLAAELGAFETELAALDPPGDPAGAAA